MIKADMPNKKLSIVVPAHELTRSVERCLDSMLQLEPPAHELILVIDGSNAELTGYASQHGIFAIKVPDLGGPARARNIGAAQATGEILLFLDSDVMPRTDIAAC